MFSPTSLFNILFPTCLFIYLEFILAELQDFNRIPSDKLELIGVEQLHVEAR